MLSAMLAEELNSSTYRCQLQSGLDEQSRATEYNINCINFTQLWFGLKNHGISAQQKALYVMCKLNPPMHKLLSILAISLFSNVIHAQYTYHGQVFSVIRHEPITFGVVRLSSQLRTSRDGKELAKIDSVGKFTFSLKDTSNIQIAVDCSLNGRKIQRIYYSDSVTKIYIKTDCYDYNSDRAKKDIEKKDIYLLCDLGYPTYKFNTADSVFQKKYGITYYMFGDQPIWSDCMWLYNTTIAEYLDKKFGDIWRKEVRWDVPFK